MKSAGKARNNGLYRHIRTSKEIIRNLLNDYRKGITKVQGMLPFLPKMPGAVRPIALACNHENRVNLTLTIAAQNFACKWDGYRI